MSPFHYPRVGFALCTASALVALDASNTAAQPAASAAPPAAYSVGSAFDVDRGRLVIFGGFVRGTYAGNTWEWDGRAWTLVTSDGPSARNSPAMVYDAARRQVVLFGGDTRTTGALGDTWVYDGASWRQAATAGPPPRTTHQMVYDSGRQRVVLFGGSAGQQMFGDTWEWDGTRWTERSTTGPEARTLYGLAYDASRGRTVLFGGTSRLAQDAPSYADTWEWDGSTWTKATATGPSARDHVSMGYDPVRRGVVLHGGGMGPVDPGETWAYDGKAWTRVTASGPRRRYARLEFDSRANAMLLFGGFDREPSNELWRLTGSTWEKMGSESK